MSVSIRSSSTDGALQFNGTDNITVGSNEVSYNSMFIYCSNRTVTTNTTLRSNESALSLGPITVNAGVTVTIPAGTRWIIL